MIKSNIESISSQQEIDATSGISKNSSKKKFKISPVFTDIEKDVILNTIYDKNKIPTDSTHL